MTVTSPFGAPVAAKRRPRWLVPAVVGGVVLVLLLTAVGQYNGLNDREVDVERAAADIQVVEQRRYDLVPNLVDAVERATDQEQEVLVEVARARAAYGTAASADERVAAANQLESGLGRLLAVVEDSPELRSIDTIENLQVQLEGSENRIAQARRDYNEAASEYNRTRRSFPTVLYAGALGFGERELYQAQPGSENAPRVGTS